MSKIKSYCVVLTMGEPEDRIIRGISVEGGKTLMESLKKEPPQFVEVKGKLIATKTIAQIVPVYL